MRAPRILTLLLCLEAIAAARGADSADLVANMERAYAGLDDVQADFTQIASSQALSRKVMEKGHLVLKRPGLMRFEYQTPEEKLFVNRDGTSYFYVPADNQVIEASSSGPSQYGIDGLMLDGDPRFSENYSIREIEPDAAGRRQLRFEPRRETDFDHALVSIDEHDLIARRIVIVDRAGNTTEYLFDHLRFNGGVERAVFDWTPPAGVEIVRR